MRYIYLTTIHTWDVEQQAEVEDGWYHRADLGSWSNSLVQ